MEYNSISDCAFLASIADYGIDVLEVYIRWLLQMCQTKSYSIVTRLCGQSLCIYAQWEMKGSWWHDNESSGPLSATLLSCLWIPPHLSDSFIYHLVIDFSSRWIWCCTAECRMSLNCSQGVWFNAHRPRDGCWVAADKLEWSNSGRFRVYVAKHGHGTYPHVRFSFTRLDFSTQFSFLLDRLAVETALIHCKHLSLYIIRYCHPSPLSFVSLFELPKFFKS